MCSWLHSLKGWSLLKTRGDSNSRIAMVVVDIVGCDGWIPDISLRELPE
jgi:hypothetical protein